MPKKDRPRNPTLQLLLKKSEALVNENTALWVPFARERVKSLALLLEITRLLDKHTFNIEIEELSISEKEAGVPIIEIDGYFRSERGLGYHHADWEEPKKRLTESPLLEFVEMPTSTSAAERGVRFNLKMKKRT